MVNEITQDMRDICMQMLQIYKDNVNKASKQLSDTARYTIKWKGKWFEVFFRLQDYWKYVEAGTKPHFPPVEAIEEWIRVKPIVPYATDGKVPTTKQLAYLIGRSISEKGTKAYFPLRKSMEESEQLINELVNAIVLELEKQIVQDIEEL